MKTFDPLYTIQQIAISILVVEALLVFIHLAMWISDEDEKKLSIVRWIMTTCAVLGVISILIISS